MSDDGYYYLHENGDLIWKRFRPEEETGGFVRRVWHLNVRDRDNAWTILLEALALGARESRIRELAAHWRFDAKDLVAFMMLAEPNPLTCAGVRQFLAKIIGVDPNAWFDWLASTPAGATPDFSTMPKNAVSRE